MKAPRLFSFLAVASATLCPPPTIHAATHEVGDGQPYTSIGAVPWESLQPGDQVRIHWRSTPYKEKWVICRQGTAAAPITVSGVPGPGGVLPVIDGNGATTRLALDFWSEGRGIIKIGGASIPADTMPKFIVIENLDIRSARSTFSFTDDSGISQTYQANASAVYVEKGENITIRNCQLHDCGNGLFVASAPSIVSRDILVEGNAIFDNGNVNSIYEHNNYTAAIGITFQFNYFGPLRAGAGGNNLKDRSAGLVVRYNWIESGNRQLDLVDAEDSALIQNDPRYRQTHVYGNVLIEPEGAGNRQIVHYGGDSGNTAIYRQGTLFFYNNTIVSTRTDRTTLLRLSSNNEHCDFRNNISQTPSAPGSTIALVDDTGSVALSHNWFQTGWVYAFFGYSGSISDDYTSVTGSSPGFVDEAGRDFHLAATSACRNTGAALNSLVLPAQNVVNQYVQHQAGEPRPGDGVLDIGAYEFASGQAPDLVITTASLPSGTAFTSYSTTLEAAGGVTPYSWSLISGSLPSGLSLNPSTGVIAGTSGTATTSTFTVQVSDSQVATDSATKTFTLVINPRPPVNITTTSLPNARRNRSYTQTLQATGGLQPYAWSISAGTLPPGMTLNPTSGVISGTSGAANSYTFTVRAVDSQAPAASDSQALSIRVK